MKHGRDTKSPRSELALRGVEEAGLCVAQARCLEGREACALALP